MLVSLIRHAIPSLRAILPRLRPIAPLRRLEMYPGYRQEETPLPEQMALLLHALEQKAVVRMPLELLALLQAEMPEQPERLLPLKELGGSF